MMRTVAPHGCLTEPDATAPSGHLLKAAPEAELKNHREANGAIEEGEVSEEAELTEAQMRRALGLTGPSRTGTIHLPAAPFRADQEGGPTRSSRAVGPEGFPTRRTPSVPDQPSSWQRELDDLEQRLTAERQKSEQAHRQLRGAELALQALARRTQDETASHQAELASLQQATIRAQRMLDETLFAIEQRGAARRVVTAAASQQSGESLQTQSPAQTAALPSSAPDPEQAGTASGSKKAIPAVKTPAAAATKPKKRGRPRSSPLPEPKPVRWWTPSYRAKAKG